jgi:low affinity Fe/Cu permease
MKTLLRIGGAFLAASVILCGSVIVWILVGLLPQYPALWTVYSFGQAAAVISLMLALIAAIFNECRKL